MQISAEESAMQTLNRGGLRALKAFIEWPAQQSSKGLVCVPILYKILDYELRCGGKYSQEILGVCKWMDHRASDILDTLLRAEPTSLMQPNPCRSTDDQEFETRDWERVSVSPKRKMKNLPMILDWVLLRDASTAIPPEIP